MPENRRFFEKSTRVAAKSLRKAQAVIADVGADTSCCYSKAASLSAML
jgi:hypothetical protein